MDVAVQYHTLQNNDHSTEKVPSRLYNAPKLFLSDTETSFLSQNYSLIPVIILISLVTKKTEYIRMRPVNCLTVDEYFCYLWIYIYIYIYIYEGVSTILWVLVYLYYMDIPCKEWVTCLHVKASWARIAWLISVPGLTAFWCSSQYRSWCNIHNN